MNNSISIPSAHSVVVLLIFPRTSEVVHFTTLMGWLNNPDEGCVQVIFYLPFVNWNL